MTYDLICVHHWKAGKVAAAMMQPARGRACLRVGAEAPLVMGAAAHDVWQEGEVQEGHDLPRQIRTQVPVHAGVHPPLSHPCMMRN